MNIGKTILKGIFQNCWIRIEYKNSKEEITSFMIRVKDINTYKKTLICDSFNIAYSSNVEKKDIDISFDRILSADLCSTTYIKTPQELLDKITSEPSKYHFLQTFENKSDILDYYINCFKLDTTPYVDKSKMIEGLDNEELDPKTLSYKLNDSQFKKLVNEIINHVEKKKKKDNNTFSTKELAMNMVSINKKEGLYVLAYKPLFLKIETKELVASPSVYINKEFAFDPDKKEVEYKETIYKYFPEEESELLNEFEKNYDRIIDILHEYNETKHTSYKKEIKIDSRPFIIQIGRKLSVDIDKELGGIKDLISNSEELSLPLKTFFGENVSLARKVNYPIFTIDDKFNIDQINAIHTGMKSPASYIQGPPGTGKTQTLLNAIITAYLNDKTVLVCSNNNIPMDGVYSDILDLKYKDDIPLLFPAIRLGSSDNIKSALRRIHNLVILSKKLTPEEAKINKIKENRKEQSKELNDILAKYVELTDLKDRQKGLIDLLNNTKEELLKIRFEAELDNLNRLIGDIEKTNMDDFINNMKIDYKPLFMAIHFDTAARLKRLAKAAKYNDLYTIILMNTDNEEDERKQVLEFKKFLSNSKNLKLFQEIFPIIISTNLSCTYLGEPGKNFDIVMMDEAGQCNVANALIPISRGKQLMLVGDPQQLSPVIVLDNKINDMLKEKYHISEEYDYIKNSIYTTYTIVDLVNKETLLSYHYRCNDKIIGFSNKKYYNNKLHLKGSNEEQVPLVFVDTSAQQERETNIRNISEVEAAYIDSYLNKCGSESVGIITPFVHQKECIEERLAYSKHNDVIVGTVHAYQGDQKDTIIFSTAITKNTKEKTYDWVKCNKELINVAVTRAKNKLIVLGDKEAVKALSNGQDDLKELINYVDTNGESKITNVAIESTALGTRQMSTESEKELQETINQILSVLGDNIYIKSEVAISSIFDGSIKNDLFYTGKFDIVIFEKTYSGDIPRLAVELNGPEHYSDEAVMKRDNEKKELCDKHNLKLLSISRDCARDYYKIKKNLEEFFKKEKR